MKKYSANYTYSNHNFVIQNLKEDKIENQFYPWICILKNILQRGCPTLMSEFLQEKLWVLHKEKYFKDKQVVPLISKIIPKWERMIRGDDEKLYYPARDFFYDIIPTYLSEYQFIQQLMVPEVLIKDIVWIDNNNYSKQQVDFYLPQAYLIIEIDGVGHNIKEDAERDEYTRKYWIKTVRISTSELQQKNTAFNSKIENIKSILKEENFNQKNRKDENENFIWLSDYKRIFNKSNISIDHVLYKATAIIRFQLLILDLLENWKLDFKQEWQLNIIERDVKNFAEIAIKDLFIWLKNIYTLHKVEFQGPKINIFKYNNLEELSKNDRWVNIDFSLLQRFTDENKNYPNINFVRTDYFDEFKYFSKSHANNDGSFEITKIDYFKIATDKIIKYNLFLDKKSNDSKSLLFLMWNIFLQINDNLNLKTLNFREWQLAIIASALWRKDTIWLLPTWAGKSICYQLSAILQPAISFVVVPIKSLMFDQKQDLDDVFFTRTNHLTGDNSPEERTKIQNEFKDWKYMFIFISPERFQSQVFRDYLFSVTNKFSIAYAVIDEVHCLSEWGHDFRTSYLNLAKTINKYCKTCSFLWLTATASKNVLKNIQSEFKVKPENIKMPLNYTREELEFNIINDNNNKYKVLTDKLLEIKKDIWALENEGKDTKSWIIFTSFVWSSNTILWCYQLAENLKNEFNIDVEYYSWKQWKKHKIEIEPEDFNDYKNAVQQKFKNNKLSLITATKAFGMGINKWNIFYTVHYGIPSSMESLYQEAGRAGRDKSKFWKQKAQCLVLLTRDYNQENLAKIFDKDTTFEELQKYTKSIKWDLNSNLFLFNIGLKKIETEFRIIKYLYEQYAKSGGKNIIIKWWIIDWVKIYKNDIEKEIYRLSQLWVIDDWTINKWRWGGEFLVDFKIFDKNSIRNALLETIKKYEKTFNLNEINNNPQYSQYLNLINKYSKNEIDSYILILLQWIYDHFAYNRRQSLKTIYENCCDVIDWEITNKEFKNKIENYFKITKSTDILQEISEKPYDYEKWFKVFYNNEEKGFFLNSEKIEEIIGGLSRFLESYRNNTGLNLISWLLRLLLNDFNNTDWRIRFESALDNIQSDEKNFKIDFILEEILKIWKDLDEDWKLELSKSLFKYFWQYKYQLKIQEYLQDKISATFILNEKIVELKGINKIIDKKIGKFGRKIL